MRLDCPLCGAVVADGPDPVVRRCPSCGARVAGDGESPPEALERALGEWGVVGLDPHALARRLFEEDPPPAPAPAVAITSDRRAGFYRWWVFVRPGDVDAGPILEAVARS